MTEWLNWTERRQKTCTQKSIRYWWKKSKMTQTDGKIYQVLGSEESILLKWPYYPRQSTDSMQFLSYYQWHFSQNWNKKNLKIFMKIKKTLKSQNTLEKEEQMWRNDAPWLQIILQSYNHKNSMAWTQNQTNRSME